jgi:hypothetical protein
MEKKIVCFFITENGIVPITKTIDASDSNAEAKSISEIVRNPEFKFYNLAFVLDADSETYHAEYLKGLADFHTRKHLLNMETVIRNKSKGDIKPHLPINAFAWKEVEPLSFEESNYFNCPSEFIEVTNLSQLETFCFAFNKDGTFLDRARISGTFEWPLDNELCHIVGLDSGNIVLRPSHKIILCERDTATVPKLPAYKKLRHEWILKQ